MAITLQNIYDRVQALVEEASNNLPYFDSARVLKWANDAQLQLAVRVPEVSIPEMIETETLAYTTDTDNYTFPNVPTDPACLQVVNVLETTLGIDFYFTTKLDAKIVALNEWLVPTKYKPIAYIDSTKIYFRPTGVFLTGESVDVDYIAEPAEFTALNSTCDFPDEFLQVLAYMVAGIALSLKTETLNSATIMWGYANDELNTIWQKYIKTDAPRPVGPVMAPQQGGAA